jgi:hypothetical protein
MDNQLIETIVSQNDNIRNRSINYLLKGIKADELLKLSEELEKFRISSGNLYHKVRASLFLFVIFRFYLQENPEVPLYGKTPFNGVRSAYERDFEGALDIFLKEIIDKANQNSTVFSAIADTYHKIAFKYLLDQVKLSISQCNENYLLYNMKGLHDYPYAVPSELSTPDSSGIYPVGLDTAPVRLDPSHSGWSDIFFLGMDFPEGARVVNISVNLKIYGTDGPLLPPCECYCRYIHEPVIRLTSVDLMASKDINNLEELFNFGNDHLSLLKAGVVSSGIIPPSYESSEIRIKDILEHLLKKPGGIEVVTRVNNIPKGSRLAVSTTLLSTIIARLMRFSGQIKDQTGSLKNEDRRTVASRAILGEWLGGSGGGWQDSGGLWPGIKVITGKSALPGDPEYGISRGCLLPEHNLLSEEEIPDDLEDRLISSIVLVHGGISQDVGPVLEMVTEKYLLKYKKEWEARLKGIRLFDMIVDSLKKGDMMELGRLTTEDWEDSIQKVIPWVNNAFTESLLNTIKKEFGDDYWGFLMLGGMSGGGMAFIINPSKKDKFKTRVVGIMRELKDRYESSLPFIIDPVAYDFEFNHNGIAASLLNGHDAIMPDLQPVSNNNISHDEINDNSEDTIRQRFGFDIISHEHMKTMLKNGEIGIEKNRLPLTSTVDDVNVKEIEFHKDIVTNTEYVEAGDNALRKNEVAVVTLAGGMGSRWTQGAAVVKSISPFININGIHRSFLEIHLAKSRKTGQLHGHRVPHVFTTSYLTHDAILSYMSRCNHFGHESHIYLSPSKTIGHRVYPMERDLRFYWNEQLRQKHDENVQKVQDDAQSALIKWTKVRGEGEDYMESSVPLRFNPPGHWYEVPNMLKNGVLAKMLTDNPNLKYLFCHNVDTIGACIEPALLGAHIADRSCLTFEVTPRRVDDEGGGLAIVDGRVRLIEGLALPSKEDEFRLSFYSSMTNWITIDTLLEYFNLDRDIIMNAAKRPELEDRILKAIIAVERMIPTYVTIKNVKHIWGSGQEDVYPVAQFEKLWGDMTGLQDLKTGYFAVPRFRGQQLKEPSQLDMLVTDGSFDYISGITLFNGS